MDITKVLYELDRAKMMADVSGQLADQRMRRIQFELLPKIEELESKVKKLEAGNKMLLLDYLANALIG